MKNHISSVASAILIAGAVLFTQGAHAIDPENPFKRSAALAAKEGGVHGGGGDAKTELRIKNIRQDILDWIQNGGAKGLRLSLAVTYQDYVDGNESKNLFGMRDILAPGAVVINAIQATEQRMHDEELNTYVDGKPKTCKGILAGRDGRPHIICEAERFSELSESEQYQQIHHEYAALGNLEKNVGSDSDYWISKQVTGHLARQVVLKLAIKKIPSGSKCPVVKGITCGDLVMEEHHRSIQKVKAISISKFLLEDNRWYDVAYVEPLKTQLKGISVGGSVVLYVRGDRSMHTVRAIAGSFFLLSDGKWYNMAYVDAVSTEF